MYIINSFAIEMVIDVTWPLQLLSGEDLIDVLIIWGGRQPS